MIHVKHLYNQALGRLFSVYGFQTCSILITWELVRNCPTLLLDQFCAIRNSGDGVKQTSGDSDGSWGWLLLCQSSSVGKDLGSIPGLGRCPWEGKGYPLQYSGLENSVDRPWDRKESDMSEWLSLLFPLVVVLLPNKAWVCLCTCSKADILTLACGDRKCSIYCKTANTKRAGGSCTKTPNSWKDSAKHFYRPGEGHSNLVISLCTVLIGWWLGVMAVSQGLRCLRCQ